MFSGFPKNGYPCYVTCRQILHHKRQCAMSKCEGEEMKKRSKDMSRKKTFFFSALFTLVIMMNVPMQVNAFYTDEETSGVQEKAYTEQEEVIMLLPVKELQVDDLDIVIETVVASYFLEVNGILDDGNSVELAEEASYLSSNADVVFPYRGRLLAMGTGFAVVTVSYEDVSVDVNVSVLAPLEIPDDIPTAQNSNVDISIAREMVFCEWEPLLLMESWTDSDLYTRKYYYPGTTYTGILYTQNDCNSTKTFLENAANINSGFYTPIVRKIIPYTDEQGNQKKRIYYQPKFGNDCSGFLSLAWGISRKTTSEFFDGIKNGTYEKVGQYTIPSDYMKMSSASQEKLQKELKVAYDSLQQGDALVCRKTKTTINENGKEEKVDVGHTFIVYLTNPSTKLVYVYEQTNPNAIIATWTYDMLANGNYLPFRKK